MNEFTSQFLLHVSVPMYHIQAELFQFLKSELSCEADGFGFFFLYRLHR